MTKLTETQLRAWTRAGTPIAGKSDGNGLTFTLSANATAAWVLRYRVVGRDEAGNACSRSRELTLGRYPDIPLGAARALALQARANVQKGFDVSIERQKAKVLRAGGTFRQLVDDYLLRVGPSLAESTRKEARRFANKDLIPLLGSWNLIDITPGAVVTAVERIAKRSRTVARRGFELLSVIFSHGVAKQMIPTNPCVGLKVSAIIGELKVRRERIQLTREELRAVLTGLSTLGRENELAIRIILATCVRKGELLGARWEHVNLRAALWTIPDEASKNGRGFVIPLAPQVVEWFNELRTMAADSLNVLPGRGVRYGARRKTAARTTLNAALNRLAVGARRFSPHDLRSTARSYLAELGVSVFVAERCLNHSLGGLIAVYDKHDYFEERRAALKLWASFLEQVELGQQSGKVFELRPAALAA